MEELKRVIPINLKRMIFESTTEDLSSTCCSLLDFFLHLPLFHSVLQDLTDPEMAICRKNTKAALDYKQKGNECFSSGDYVKALSFYSQGLRFAPMDADDANKSLVTMLYANRASSLHKMGLLMECIRDCGRALLLSPSYTKAWYRRGKANASLANYEDAIRDLNVALDMELSLHGKSQIKCEIDTILDHCRRTKGTSSSWDSSSERNFGSCGNSISMIDEPHPKVLQCVSTPTKGRGMASIIDIAKATLVHTEEPYAAIILKHCRETHCHFCLNALPADTVPCSSCSIPLYCSQHCQVQAGGQFGSCPNNPSIPEKISKDLERYMAEITVASNSGYIVGDANIEYLTEHKHECGGVHWPVVLPSEIVLAGRVLVKSIEQRKHSSWTSKPIESLDLFHNYAQMTPERKLELHIYSIVLTHCLQHDYGSVFPLTGTSASQVVILISQIKVNSMAVVHMKSVDEYSSSKQSGPQLSRVTNVEQVRVGQAIYATGSLFNHSCQPNIHAYFLSRSLFIRSTEFVAAGQPLELSYGPQIGQMTLMDRHQSLEDQYAFKCQCCGCSELNLSDLAANAFRCVEPNCSGAVLDICMAKHEKQKVSCVDKLKVEDINKVAHMLFQQNKGTLRIHPGYCLNCGSQRDLESSHATAKQARIYVKRLRDAIDSKQVSINVLSDALQSLDLLRSTIHSYNKEIAEAEDIIAEAFCSLGDFQAAMDHCKASIEILEKLYTTNHIVIGNELVKLATIQLSLGESTVVEIINRLDKIFSMHYGPHATRLFPYLQTLKGESSKHTE
ncbi:SET and MYND domain-containing protein 4 isoform X2 [Telopea speciosissima]|uniref:SET and MYND domain-containing protein 4 isoform X2 n=1 Tax=Telopea speciosissima TaxID=54955 RepID=UPI001CC7F8B9|nr:SET and MYND domain-containing protein 4 isoform X2 [Telopea speciosissima]